MKKKKQQQQYLSVKLNEHFVNALKNIDSQQTIHSTQTPQQQSLPTLINLATRWKTWNFFRWNCNHPQHMSRHKVRDVYLIDIGKTLSPDGLNRRNED